MSGRFVMTCDCCLRTAIMAVVVVHTMGPVGQQWAVRVCGRRWRLGFLARAGGGGLSAGALLRCGTPRLGRGSGRSGQLADVEGLDRSEERRVGKECRSRWS